MRFPCRLWHHMHHASCTHLGGRNLRCQLFWVPWQSADPQFDTQQLCLSFAFSPSLLLWWRPFGFIWKGLIVSTLIYARVMIPHVMMQVSAEEDVQVRTSGVNMQRMEIAKKVRVVGRFTSGRGTDWELVVVAVRGGVPNPLPPNHPSTHSCHHPWPG